jgi:hypothetical protein
MQGFLQQFVDRAFEPEAVTILTGAFDDAWKSIEASQAPWAADDYALAGRTIIAKYIVTIAKAGNLNRRSLAQEAVLYLARQKLHRKPPDSLL